MVGQQNRRSITGRPWGNFLIIVSKSIIDFFLRVRKGQEAIGLQAFGREASVEGFDVRVFGWLAGPQEVQRHAE